MKPFTINNDSFFYDLTRKQNRGLSLQAHISDIHFGVMDPKVEYQILKEQFIDKISGLPLDCISIDGDLFDRLVMSNTDAILYASLFVKDLIDLCRMNESRGQHTVLVLIAGTRNHDAGQLRLFYQYINDPSIDIRIVEEIRFEYINGCKILCIPELYNIDDSVYNEVLFQSGYYDMCFGHGTIQGAVYDNNQSVARIFSPRDFSFCLGPVVFGHVHPGGSFHGFCYYNGSPVRWCFGEEETKGFQLVLYDMDSHGYYVYKEPITSFRYDTIPVDDILMNDPQKVIAYIDNRRQSEGIDYIRIKCTQSPNVDILKEYYRTDNTVKFLIEKEKGINSKSISESVELYDKYSYFFNKSMSPYEIFARFVNDSQSDIIISAQQIIDIINEK
jgi:hypothetical protein